MYISVDPKSSTPLYVQIKEQMRLAVASGAIKPGEQVPTVRDLATQLRINLNTVARAYRELQSEGLLTSRQGSGTFVSPDAQAISQTESRQMVRQMLDRVAATARSLQIERDELLALVAEVIDRISQQADTNPEVNGNE